VLLPFTVRGDVAGMELLRPIALVVLGGLVTCTLVTLFLLPALYVRLPSRHHPGPPEPLRGEPEARGAN
jgi:Cu/Ag efflux pump CusA